MSAEDVKKNNAKIVEERGPGLYWDMGIYIAFKDTEGGMVMLAGLGGLGIGRSWYELSEADKSRPGYDEAPEAPEAPDSFGDTAASAKARMERAKEKYGSR